MKNIIFIVLFLGIQIPLTKAQQLDYFITQGLKNSPSLNEYRNQVDASVADSLLVKASNKPQVNSNSQILYAPSYKNFGYDNAVTNGGNYASVVDVSQYIFNHNTLKNKYENVNIQKQAWQNTAKISASDLKKVITNQYLAATTDYNEVNNKRTYFGLMIQNKDILKQLAEQGIYKQTDYLSLVIEAQTAEIDLSQQQTQFVKDVYLLRQLCGINDTTQFIPEMPLLDILQPVTQANSPLFMQFKIDSLKISNEQKSINFRYVPKISWYANAGIMSSDPAFLYRHLGYSIGLNMSIPIFDGHQRKQEYQKLSMRENTRSNYENYFKNQYTSQVKQLNSELQATRHTLGMLKEQLSTTNELVALLKTELNSGNVTIIELINTMKNYLLVSRNMNQLQVREFEIINELNYLMQQ